MTSRTWLIIGFWIACVLSMQIAYAQGLSSRTARLIIPTAPGGPLDTMSRGLVQSLAQVFGQSFVVENRVGADGTLALEACARSAPDGMTLCLMDSWPIVLNPAMNARLSYDPDRDLGPIIHCGTLGSALVVHPSVQANSLRELLELAKARPNTITFGTYGLASNTYFYVEWLKKAKGILFLGVPYKAATQAMQAVLAGEIQVFAFGLGQSIGQAKAGKVRILAVAGEERSPSLPDTPSFKESGMELSMRTWFGMFAPAATPGEIVRRLNGEVGKILAVPQFREKFIAAQGIEMTPPAGGSTEAFAKYVRQEREMYTNLVKVVGSKTQ